MDGVAVRVFTLSILPVIIAAGHLGLDRSSRPRERRLEIFMLYLFGVGVAGSGIGGFFGHFFISDSVAESIGWPTGNPFQLEVGFANLALGILGIGAMSRRDGFREATVVAASVFGLGATVVHVMDVIESGNLAPGNTIQNVSNLLRPVLLIAFLAASRRAERSPDSEAQTSGFDRWREPRIRAAGLMTVSVAAGFGAGFAIDLPAIGTLIGTLVGAGLAALVVARFPVSPAGGVAPIVAITPATRATAEHPDGQTIRPSAGTGKSGGCRHGGAGGAGSPGGHD
jgi:4-amino-4-deoxy-L-arabinose transferase-like glycosyltransferase